MEPEPDLEPDPEPDPKPVPEQRSRAERKEHKDLASIGTGTGTAYCIGFENYIQKQILLLFTISDKRGGGKGFDPEYEFSHKTR